MIFFNEINSHVTTLDGIRGVVKFHGPVEVSENRFEDMVGILLEEIDSGDSNGEFNGKIYFHAKENSAIFISVDEVVHLDHTLLVNVSKVTTPDGKIGVVKFIDIIKFSVGKTIVKKVKLLLSISNDILSSILNQFLTIHEIIILRTTCTEFLTILIPNDENMVMFCKNIWSKEMIGVPLIWFDVIFLYFVLANFFEKANFIFKHFENKNVLQLKFL